MFQSYTCAPPAQSATFKICRFVATFSVDEIRWNLSFIGSSFILNQFKVNTIKEYEVGTKLDRIKVQLKKKLKFEF